MADSDRTPEQRRDEICERILDAVKDLDALVAEHNGDERNGTDMLTHCLVITSWHQAAANPEDDSTQITDYRVTPMAVWQCLGLSEAASQYFRARLVGGDLED
jgi:hypothetical protein